MEDVVNRLAKELTDAIAAAVADDSRVEACRETARAAGYELRVSLEATISIMSRSASGSLARVGSSARSVATRRRFEINANDRRFLRSLRIAADETAEQVE